MLHNSLSKITGHVKNIEDRHDKLENNNKALKDFLEAMETSISRTR